MDEQLRFPGTRLSEDDEGGIRAVCVEVLDHPLRETNIPLTFSSKVKAIHPSNLYSRRGQSSASGYRQERAFLKEISISYDFVIRY
jgi:hypothetical protein